MGLRASEAPALNEPVTITLEAHASESAPGTEIRIRLPEGAEVLDGSTRVVVDLEPGEAHELRVVARLTKASEQTIEGRAFRAVSEDEAWGDMDALFLTVEKDRGFMGFASGCGEGAREAAGFEPGRE